MQHFSIRKLSIGAASVLIGISFLGVQESTVKADSLQNASETELTKSKTANDVIKQDTGSNIERDADSNIEQEHAFNIKQDTGSNIEQEPASETDAKQITNNQPNYAQTPAKPATPKPNSNQQNAADLEAKPQTPDKVKLQANRTITSDEANRTEVATTTLTTTTGKKFNTKMLFASKVVSPANDTNGGFDSSWGTLNVNDWKGNVQGDYYQLTDYTGDANHVIVPNEADFAKAGISTSGKQVGVTSDLMHTIFTNKATAQDATIAFSKTDNKMIKAINSNWHNTWESQNGKLSKFDGTSLDVSNVTNMSYMFYNNQISDLSSLANWNTNNVTNMAGMFEQNQISDLNPLTNWKVDNVSDISGMFYFNHISNLSPLVNWNVNNVTSMYDMFGVNQISDLSPLANWKVNNVTDMNQMFEQNHISDLSPLANWKVDNVSNMGGMFGVNQISDLSPLVNWKVDHVSDISGMFQINQISDLSPLASWNVDNVTNMAGMFYSNATTQTKNLQAKRVINFVYPDGYTGKKQDTVTQTVDVPQTVNVTLTTKDSKPSNNILDWVTKTETPISTPTDPVYFQDYTVPEIKGLLEPDKTVISKQQADVTKPINVTVTYKLVDSNNNDAYALDSKNELHEHANVNDNGGYDADFWGKINVDDWNYTVNGNTITITGLKDGASTGVNDAVIVPNLDDFKLAGKDGGAKTVYISSSALGKTAQHKYYGLSKTNGNKFATDSNLNSTFYDNRSLTHADFNSLNTSSITNMGAMFNSANNLTSIDVSNWDTGNVTDISHMFSNTYSLTSLDVSNWDTSKVTNMRGMFSSASSLTSLDVSKWNTGNVTDMGYMFDYARSLTDLDVSNWDTRKVTNMYAMFCDARSLTSLDVSKWNTGNVTNMGSMFNSASSLTSLDVSKWNTGNVTDMGYMFSSDPKLALIVNGDKFADYLVNHDSFADYLVNHDSFAESDVNSDVKSVTTDNTKLLQLLTNDAQHKSATRTIVFTFPANYSPDLTKYHLTKVGNTYQIKQSADYDKQYLQGTVLINGADDITEHHIDTTKKNKLSNTWQPNYNKLVLAHKNSDGSVSFDVVQLPKVPGYKTVASLVNPARALFVVSFMALPKPVAPAISDAKPAGTVSPATPVAIEVAKPIETEPKVAITPKVIDLSNDAVVTTPKETTWQVADEPSHDTYHVFNGQYAVELPHISNAQLHVIANDSTKDSILFTYKGQNNKYVFKVKFLDGHYLLTTYEIKANKLVKLIDYNFVKSSKMSDLILDWLKLN